MVRRLMGLGVILGGLLAAGCGSVVQGERNAFLTLTDTFGLGTAQEGTQGQAAGTAAKVAFRKSMTFTFSNNNPEADVVVAFVAWVLPSSIRSADQQDALFAGGYVQLTSEVRLGSAFTLPVGTFVYNGTGTAGATLLQIPAAKAGESGAVQPTSRAFTLITPDVFLAFLQPPVSCESVAFLFTDRGFPLDAQYVSMWVFEGATGQGGLKTLAQVETYQCDPLRPGLFLRVGGGAAAENEYYEGDEVVFEFNPTPENGKFVNVTISSP